MFRVLYWVLGVSLVILIVTGVGLHAVARPGWPLLGRVSAKTIESLVLTAEKTKRSPESVEALRTLDWAVSVPRKIDLNNGVGFSNGATTLDLRAIYDDHFLYVRAQWVDPTDSTLYWPVKRTADGWHYMQTSLHDEQIHYEDKFAMVFPIGHQPAFTQFGCALSCHQGKDTDRFPYGYKASKTPIDVWHWKGSRSGSVGYIDDKYWHHADMNRKDVGRYGDGGQSAPYTKNINKEQTAPLYLPKDESYVINNGGALKREGAVEYSEELAKDIPEGTLVPGVVVSAFEGDRGDVECAHDYSNGKHTLWIRRKLDTGSSNDARFVPGDSIPFCVSAFDHAAKRHAYHLAVYTLYLKPPAE